MKKLSPGERTSTFPGRLLHDGRHYRVEILPGAKTVLLVRSPYPFVSPDDVDAGCTPVQLILDKLGRSGYNVLVDTRHATANNDPVYESWFEAHRKRMVQGFRRAAIVIRTAVGGLQTRRLIQHDGSRSCSSRPSTMRSLTSRATEAFPLRRPAAGAARRPSAGHAASRSEVSDVHRREGGKVEAVEVREADRRGAEDPSQRGEWQRA